MAIVNRFPSATQGKVKEQIVIATTYTSALITSEESSEEIYPVFSSSISSYNPPELATRKIGCTPKTFNSSTTGKYKITILSRRDGNSYGFMFGVASKGSEPPLNPNDGYAVRGNSLSVGDEFTVIIQSGYAKLYDKQNTLLCSIRSGVITSSYMLYIAAVK